MILLASTPMPFAALLVFATLLGLGSIVLSIHDAIKTLRK
jgi:hypothetical protein